MNKQETATPAIAPPADAPIGTNEGDREPVAALYSKHGLNRKSRRTDYAFMGEMDMPTESGATITVPLYCHRTQSILVFLMPDGSSYRVEPSIIGYQLYKHWKRVHDPQNEKTPALPEAGVSKSEN